MNLLENYSSEELLRELLDREEPSMAPTKTTYGGGMLQWTVGVGKDEIATITMHSEGVEYLAGVSV